MLGSRLNLHLSRRTVAVLGLAVAAPALFLAGLGIFLTLRVSGAIENESVRYNTYMALQVGEAFEQELMSELRHAIAPAENAARAGATPDRIVAALREAKDAFLLAPAFVKVDDLTGFSLLIVESQPLVYAPAASPRGDTYFAGLLLRDARGQVVGAGGWWISPRTFLAAHLDPVLHDRLPGNSRLYGGYENIRKLAIQIVGPEGSEVGHVREPGTARSGHVELLSGPFERYTVLVAPTGNAPVAWATHFVALAITFIGLLGLAIVLAAVFGLRYAVLQLEMAQMKAGFVSNVTHELKTPIALIRLAVETLQLRRVNTPEEHDRFLATISRETLRLQQLVDNILDFARLEAGQRPFRFENVDLIEVVRTALESIQPRLDHQGFTVLLELPESLPPVRGDSAALVHCVLNLLDNAMKYSKSERIIRLAAGTRGADGEPAEVTIAVGDRGIGIAPEDQRRVFEKFVRLETGLVHDVKGAGLGLSLVDQIVRAHEGRVELVSRPGEGSTFTIVLPVARGQEVSRPEPRRRTAS
jgi:signal transduction histidine kinase